MVQHPLPLLALVVFVVFLGVLAGLALAVTRTVSPEGRTSRGLFGTLGSMFALLFLCGLGMAGTALFGATLAIGTAIGQNPIERIEVVRADGEAPLGLESLFAESSYEERARRELGERDRRSPREGTHLRVTTQPGTSEWVEEFLVEGLGVDARDLHRSLRMHTERGPHGHEVEVLDFRLPVSEHDWRELERELRRELDGMELSLPRGLSIELKRHGR